MGIKINKSNLKYIIKENIKHQLFEHRNIVFELDTALSIIEERWQSPDDTWWVKIESRYKDHRHYNSRHGYGFNDKKNEILGTSTRTRWN